MSKVEVLPQGLPADTDLTKTTLPEVGDVVKLPAVVRKDAPVKLDPKDPIGSILASNKAYETAEEVAPGTFKVTYK